MTHIAIQLKIRKFMCKRNRGMYICIKMCLRFQTAMLVKLFKLLTIKNCVFPDIVIVITLKITSLFLWKFRFSIPKFLDSFKMGEGDSLFDEKERMLLAQYHGRCEKDSRNCSIQWSITKNHPGSRGFRILDITQAWTGTYRHIPTDYQGIVRAGTPANFFNVCATLTKQPVG